MACSAFRSTTKRSSQTGSRSGTDANGVPSTPRYKRDPSPGGRGSHRRSTSMMDFSARYLSDCSSTSESRPSYSRSTNVRGGRRSVCPSDSESEWDSLSAHRPRRRWVIESEDERPRGNLNLVPKVPDSQPKGLRRTLSSQDLSQYSNKMEHDLVVLDMSPSKRDTEDSAEEKTIKAVYDQMKSLRLEPPVADVGVANFLDSMRSEVRRAVADIRIELEESLQKSESPTSANNEGNRRESVAVVRSVADIQNEYCTKLEESERRVRELWSQIAVEERRCLELSKIVKELLPMPPPPSLETSASQASCNRRRPSRRKNSAEKQLVLESLDLEAQKYFEECVSISSFECHRDSDESFNDNSIFTKDRLAVDGMETAAQPSSAADIDVRGDIQSKEILVESDGVVLPWLKWEAEASGGGDKGPKQVARKHTSPRSSGSGGIRTGFNRAGSSTDQFYRSGSAKSNGGRKPALLEARPDKLLSMPGVLLFADDEQVGRGDHHHLDVDTVLMDRIEFKCRVDNRELLLCHGALLL